MVRRRPEPVAAIVLMVGPMLPIAHEASVSRVFAQRPDSMYRLVAERDAYPQWWTGDPRIQSEVIEATPPIRFVTRIADPEQPFVGTWTFAIVPDGGGSRLTITERGEVYNPVFRFVSRLILGHHGTMNSFMDAATERLKKVSGLVGGARAFASHPLRLKWRFTAKASGHHARDQGDLANVIHRVVNNAMNGAVV